MSKPRSGASKAPAPTRGGGAPSEDYYRARGYKTVKVRVPAQMIELWDSATEHSLCANRTEWIVSSLSAQAAEELGLDPVAAQRGVRRPAT